MLYSIQFLRAVAAWVVVGHHFMQIFFGFQRQGLVGNFFSDYGALGVDLFFVISGFVIYHATADKVVFPSQFLLSRLIRIAPAYWFFTLLTAGVVYFFQGIVPLTQFEVLFFFKSLMFIPAMNPSGIGYFPLLTPGWSLNFEMLFYLIFSFTLLFSGKNRLLALMLGFVLLHFVVPIFGTPWNFFKNKIVFEFLFGVGVAVIYRYGLLSNVSIIFTSLMLLLAIFIVMIKGGAHHYLYTGFPCALIVMAVLSQERLFPRKSSFIALGNWSYSTYLCHVLVLSLAFKLFNTFNIPIEIIIALVTISILLISKISFSLIESCSSKWLKEKLARLLVIAY